jgi:NitT/TauT family transport system substrate-binding protein
MNRRDFLALSGAAGVLAGCGRGPAKTKLALNWKPDPQFGGFYAAPYDKYDLAVELLPGGAGTPTVQMIGAGSADFGVVSADELIVARSKGNDVVALFAVYQNCPQGIMVRASRNLTAIGDVVKEGTLALQRGLPYARIIEKKYGFSKVKIVPSPGGDISVFLSDEKFAQQCFVVSEPLAAKKKGVAVKVFPVSDTGYNPYTTVLAAGGDQVRKNPELAKKMVTAVREGWRIYLDDPKPTNGRMRQLNPSMDAETFAEVAEAQKPYIQTAETGRDQLGLMTKERWGTLGRQLAELGDIPKAPPAEECYRVL